MQEVECPVKLKLEVWMYLVLDQILQHVVYF
jgi:hypothetical protein